MSMMAHIRFFPVVLMGLACSHAVPAEFAFRHHFIDKNLSGDAWGQTALADLNKDGRLEFITGQKGGPIYWYELQPDHTWVRHLLVEKSPSDVGGSVLDVDRDGWPDFVTGGVWYRHPGNPVDQPFERIVFDRQLGEVHDVTVADLDGDGRPDVLTMSDKNNLRWYAVPNDPALPWIRHDIGPSVHAGIGVGDVDGDGDLDICAKLWRARRDNANGGRNHVDFLENLRIGVDVKK